MGDLVRNQLIELSAKGVTYKEMAKRTGLPIVTIWRELKALNALKRDLTTSNTELIIQMREAGKTFAEIAKTLDMKYSTVYSRYVYHKDAG